MNFLIFRNFFIFLNFYEFILVKIIKKVNFKVRFDMVADLAHAFA